MARSTPTARMVLTTPTSEAGSRGPALRRGHQRRRRTARAVHRRATRAARLGRSADDLRARLRHVEERAAAGRRQGQRRTGAPLSGDAAAQHRSSSAGSRNTVFDQRALAGRRAAVARQRGTGEPGAHPAHRAVPQASSTSSCSSATATTTRGTGARAVAAKAVLVPTAERDPAIGLAIFRAGAPRRARAHVQLVRGARAHPARERPRRARASSSASGSRYPGAHAALAVPEEVRRQAAVRDLHRPHRREQGLRGAVLALRAVHVSCTRTASISCSIGTECAADPETPANQAPRLPVGRGQVRRAGGRRRADHAVDVREPVDGRARGVGARQAGARQRPLRRAARPGRPKQRRSLLRDVRGVRRGAVPARGRRPARRRRSAGTAATSSAGTTRGR